jgi:SAM-dependent methyltransferase
MVYDPTSQFYSANARAYAANGVREENPWLERFIGALATGAMVLELGCGAGRESAAMLARGLDVTPTDGSHELAAIASELLRREVAVLRFEDIAFNEAFDGVFANACLLHVPRADLSAILARVATSLKPGGLFYSSYKAGEAEGYDGLGRFYNYPSREWLSETYWAARCWESVEIVAEDGSAYDRLPTRWLHVMARKKA